MSNQSLPIVTICDGVATTLSTDVASFFGKRHSDVIRSIENITKSVTPDRLRNFAETVVNRENPSGGEPIQSKAYRLTRDGFTFLAMGFTGKKAQEFKWSYIDAFNAMENELRGAYALKIANTITPAQQLLIRQTVAMRAKSDARYYREIYRAIHVRFQISRYDQLLQTDLNECLKFIENFNIDDLPKEGVVLSLDQVERILDFIYYWRYLFKPELNMIYDLLRSLNSPKMARFAEVINNMNLPLLEKTFAKQGYFVELPQKYLDDYITR